LPSGFLPSDASLLAAMHDSLPAGSRWQFQITDARRRATVFHSIDNLERVRPELRRATQITLAFETPDGGTATFWCTSEARSWSSDRPTPQVLRAIETAHALLKNRTGWWRNPSAVMATCAGLTATLFAAVVLGNDACDPAKTRCETVEQLSVIAFGYVSGILAATFVWAALASYRTGALRVWPTWARPAARTLGSSVFLAILVGSILNACSG
jgi:hypothetical protein